MERLLLSDLICTKVHIVQDFISTLPAKGCSRWPLLTAHWGLQLGLREHDAALCPEVNYVAASEERSVLWRRGWTALLLGWP